MPVISQALKDLLA